jgi:hypothetical protein
MGIVQTREVSNVQTLTKAQKEAGQKQWYKDYIDILDVEGNYSSQGTNGISEYRRQKVNYDLNNNIINLTDFAHVCEPYGAEAGELPAKMVNRDIVSSRIKAMRGMEMKRPSTWKAVAVNRDATTRKEEESFGRINQYVIASIVKPIREKIEAKYQEQIKGEKLSKEEMAGIQEKIAEEVHAATPDKVKQYMEREHQDPAEVQSHQLLQYLIQRLDIYRGFNRGFEHGMLSAKTVFWVGVTNSKPDFKVVNPIRFTYDKSSDTEFFEDGEWAVAEYRWKPSEVVMKFHSDLDKKQINDIYTNYAHYAINGNTDRLFDFSKTNENIDDDDNSVRVLHCNWKALRKLGFLTYRDAQTDKIEMQIVDEDYRFDKVNGDISIDWEWIPESYEGWKIGADIYLGMQPVPGQFKDVNNLYECKLSYYGAVHDNVNSVPTSLMDRMKVYQYYYNIVMYRLELLLASDKGKKVMMNINAIPESVGIDIEKWQYFFESSPIMWYNPDEEGVGYGDVNTMAKEIDLSLVSDISKYIDIAEYLDKKCGDSVGITDTVLGQISASAEVGNTRQEIQQTSHILEPYFSLHNKVKQNVLNGLLEVAKVAYMDNPPETLSYVLDDMSVQMFNLDINLLHNSTIGIFVSNSAKDGESKETIRQLAHAALQNQKIELSDVLTVIRQEGSQEAEEILKAGEKERKYNENKQAQAERDSRLQLQREAKDWEKEKMNTEHKYKIDEIKVKGAIDLQKQAMLSIGFNEDKDVDDDGQLDVVEIYKAGKDAEIKARKQKLDEDKFLEDKMQFRMTDKNKKKELTIKEKQASKASKTK